MYSGIPLYELASGYWMSSALRAGMEVGVFDALKDGPVSVEQLAVACEADPGNLAALVDAMVGLGLLIRSLDAVDLAPEHRPFLTPGSPDSLLGAFRFNADLEGLWQQLSTCVRSGNPVIPQMPHLGADPERTRRFVEGMHSRAALMARGLLQVVKPPEGSKVLDLAGGPGTFSLKLLERDHSLQITVFDLPPVVQAAREIHAEHPVAAGLTFQGGDYHEGGLPEGQDLILYCGALHQELPQSLPGLLERMHQVLVPGGKVLIVDLLLDADRATPVYAALFDLNMRLMRPTSHVHTVDEVEGALVQGGFELIRKGDVPETPYRYLEAKRLS
jgi:SAM-dependent methyltransferase